MVYKYPADFLVTDIDVIGPLETGSDSVVTQQPEHRGHGGGAYPHLQRGGKVPMLQDYGESEVFPGDRMPGVIALAAASSLADSGYD